MVTATHTTVVGLFSAPVPFVIRSAGTITIPMISTMTMSIPKKLPDGPRSVVVCPFLLAWFDMIFPPN